MSEAISVTFSGEGKASARLGPVPAILTVKNLTASAVQILLPYPNPNHLAFQCRTPGAAIPKEVEFFEIDRVAPTSIAAGATYTATFFLNRYMVFAKPGKIIASYELSLPVTTDPGTPGAVSKDEVFTGEFPVELTETSETDLAGVLSVYAVGLRSPDDKTKAAAAEALAFLDTPICVKFVAPMLSINNLESIGIRALARFPSPETKELIVGALSHKESGVVETAFEAIAKLRIPVPRQRIVELLASHSPGIRLLAIEWLNTRPDPADWAAVAPLLKDSSEPVRTKAQAYADSLRK